MEQPRRKRSNEWERVRLDAQVLAQCTTKWKPETFYPLYSCSMFPFAFVRQISHGYAFWVLDTMWGQLEKIFPLPHRDVQRFNQEKGVRRWMAWKEIVERYGETGATSLVEHKQSDAELSKSEIRPHPSAPNAKEPITSITQCMQKLSQHMFASLSNMLRANFASCRSWHNTSFLILRWKSKNMKKLCPDSLKLLMIRTPKAQARALQRKSRGHLLRIATRTGLSVWFWLHLCNISIFTVSSFLRRCEL